MNRTESDIHFMKKALLLARAAAVQNEVPVGAILTRNNTLIAEGMNAPITRCDPTAHAEIIALRNAAAQLGNYRMPKTTLYVTLEPCIMCMGAIIHARVERLVFGAYDQKTGAAVSRYTIGRDKLLNHHLEINGGICETESAALLQNFFQERRKKNRPL